MLLRGHQEQHGTLSLFHNERFQIPGGRLRKFLQRPLHLLMWQGSIRYEVELSLLYQGLYVLSVCMYAYVRVAIYRNLKLNEWIQRYMYVHFKYAHVLKLFKNLCSVQVDTMDTSLSNSTLMNATEDSSMSMCRLSRLACLTLVCSDRLHS